MSSKEKLVCKHCGGIFRDTDKSAVLCHNCRDTEQYDKSLTVHPEFEVFRTETGSDRPKDKTGKYQPHLVCGSLTEAVARVREYGVKKYHGENGWKQQTPLDYMDAVGRHYDACRNDPLSRDEESGLLHICQIATDAMFIIQMLVDTGVDISSMKEPPK